MQVMEVHSISTTPPVTPPAISGEGAAGGRGGAPPPEKPTAADESGGARNAGPDASQRAEIERLRRTDAEVRRHEQAHRNAAGGVAAGPTTYQYTTGPDGRRYAVGGEVRIDVSKVPGDPEATIDKARVIRRAALAPAQPSAQDRAVAAQAAQMEAEAQQELDRTRTPREGEPAPTPAPTPASPAPTGSVVDLFA